MLSKRVVVWDPNPGLDRAEDGLVIHGPRAAVAAESRGMVLLPVTPELLDAPPNGCAGWVKRSFGQGVATGNDSGTVFGRRFAPVSIFFARDSGSFLNWAARLIPLLRHDRLAHPLETGAVVPSGMLSLTSDATQVGTSPGGLGGEGPLDVASLGPWDRRGGWTARGRCSLASFASGWLGVSLYGTARGVAVLWLALSQSRE